MLIANDCSRIHAPVSENSFLTVFPCGTALDPIPLLQPEVSGPIRYRASAVQPPRTPATLNSGDPNRLFLLQGFLSFRRPPASNWSRSLLAVHQDNHGFLLAKHSSRYIGQILLPHVLQPGNHIQQTLQAAAANDVPDDCRDL
jgi:hypothetical protein